MDSFHQKHDKQEIELDTIVDKTVVNKPDTCSISSNNVVTCDDEVSKPEYTGEGQKCVLSISSTNRGKLYILFDVLVFNIET